MNKIKADELENVVIDGLYRDDYPKLCEAYVASAKWKATGKDLTDEELEMIDATDINRLALLEIFSF